MYRVKWLRFDWYLKIGVEVIPIINNYKKWNKLAGQVKNGKLD